MWILASGKSAQHYDTRLFHDRRVLCVNDALFRILNAAAFYSMSKDWDVEKNVAVFSLDNDWIRRHKELLQTFPGEKHFAVDLDSWPDVGGIHNALYLRGSHADGLSVEQDTVCNGCHSGYAAINLAYLKGANTIHLLGYDLNPADHDCYRYWAPLYENMLPVLRRANVVVLNHNPNSFIQAFTKVPVSAAYFLN